MFKKSLFLGLMVGFILTIIGNLAFAAPKYTTDDIMTEIQNLRVGQAEVKAKVEILLIMYGVYAAVLAGMVWALIGLSKEVRVPKEERVLKLEEFMEKARQQLKQIDEKLHLPKPIL